MERKEEICVNTCASGAQGGGAGERARALAAVSLNVDQGAGLRCGVSLVGAGASVSWVYLILESLNGFFLDDGIPGSTLGT